MTLTNLIVLLLAVASVVQGQLRGAISSETHPNLSTSKCTSSGCTTQASKITLDANWRWLHGPAPDYNNCFPGPGWDATLCPDPVTCAKNCALDGANYANTYGVSTSGSNLTLLLFPQGGGIGSRVYLMSDDQHYQLFKLKNQELSFDVDISGIPCGANGALYFTSMPTDGGQSAFVNNKAGAYMGTGYCDAQCPRDIKFINGEYGSCCAEVDIWESNAAATAYTAHPCSMTGSSRCDSASSTACSVCDSSGCDFNPYRMGNTSFFGQGKTVSTSPGKLRVITQFITADGTSTGALSEIRRGYIRGGKVITNAASNIAGVSGNSLTDTYCSAEKKAFAETDTFAAKGGMKSTSAALEGGMVLTMSVWVDYSAHMRWLDSSYPDGKTGPGVVRGPCATSTGDPADLRSAYPNAQVQFSNIKVGDIGSTFGPPYP
ncbi:hypothetical protein FH972_022277 [Carpinus fangiana]|uniref:cellulase n=1 Tax=Carpinus fangiana TaxID=176857 RepID=A0A5N6KSE7_9ROSI|nr:hypothetical protein FH972_022277 [Carpinus fangiana]